VLSLFYTLATVWWLMKDCHHRWYDVGMTKEAREIFGRMGAEKNYWRHRR